MSAYKAKNAPIMVIDEKTGQRQMIYAQLDANATSAATRNLMILPGSNWQDGHTYVVVLRDLRNAGGHLISAPAWFEKLRDGKRLPASERSQTKRYAKIFKALKRAKVAQDKTLYAAWDFTVASTKQLTGQLLAIRNAAFSQLGDTDLGDGQVQGTAPAFTFVPNASDTPTVAGVRFVTGTFQVPCYLQTCGDTATDRLQLHLDGAVRHADADPGQRRRRRTSNARSRRRPRRRTRRGSCSTDTACSAAWTRSPTRRSTGLATGYNMVICATNWWGLAAPDQNFDTQAVSNLNLFPVMLDRLQQGVLNALFLGRLMDNSQGFASDPALRAGRQAGRSNTGELYYDGNSQGGIFGGITTAVSPDIRRAVLGVTGEDYANALVQRSTDFGSPDHGRHLLVAAVEPVRRQQLGALHDDARPDGSALGSRRSGRLRRRASGRHPFADTPSPTRC